jgi:hypothetical protein
VFVVPGCLSEFFRNWLEMEFGYAQISVQEAPDREFSQRGGDTPQGEKRCSATPITQFEEAQYRCNSLA